jgi:hypothetical protein
VVVESIGKKLAMTEQKFRMMQQQEKQAEFERLATKVAAAGEKRVFLPQQLGKESKKVSMGDPRFQAQQAAIEKAVRQQRARTAYEKDITQRWKQFKTEREIGGGKTYQEFAPPSPLLDRVATRLERQAEVTTQKGTEKLGLIKQTKGAGQYAAVYLAKTGAGLQRIARGSKVVTQPRVAQQRTATGIATFVYTSPRFLKKQVTQPMTFKQTGTALKRVSQPVIKEWKVRPAKVVGYTAGFFTTAYLAGKILGIRRKPKFKVTTAKGLEYRGVITKGKRVIAAKYIKPKVKIVKKAPRIQYIRGTGTRSLAKIGKEKVSVMIAKQGRAVVGVPSKAPPSGFKGFLQRATKRLTRDALSKTREYVVQAKGKRLSFFRGKAYKAQKGLVEVTPAPKGFKGFEKGTITFTSAKYKPTPIWKPKMGLWETFKFTTYKMFKSKKAGFALVPPETATIVKGKRFPVLVQKIAAPKPPIFAGASLTGLAVAKKPKLSVVSVSAQTYKPKQKTFTLSATKQINKRGLKQFTISSSRQLQRTALRQLPIGVTRTRARSDKVPMFPMPKGIPIPTPYIKFPKFKTPKMGIAPKRAKTKRKYRYAPTFRAYAFGIKGAIPKGTLTGLEARPLPKIKL